MAINLTNVWDTFKQKVNKANDLFPDPYVNGKLNPRAVDFATQMGMGATTAPVSPARAASATFVDDAVRYAEDLSKQLPTRKFLPNIFDVNNLKLDKFARADATGDVIKAAMAEIKRGIFRPIVVANDGGVIDGTHRILAARLLGIREWPGVIEVLK